MSSTVYVQPLITQQVAGTALTGTTTPTSILAPQALFTMPANTIDVIGKMIRIRAHGQVSNIVTTPGTLTLDVRFGSVVVANGGAMALNIVAKTNVPWDLEWILTARSVGGTTTANLMHQGKWFSESVIGAGIPTVTGAGFHMLPNAAPAVGNGFDSTAAQQVNLFATWSLANANSIQVLGYTLELLN